MLTFTAQLAVHPGGYRWADTKPHYRGGKYTGEVEVAPYLIWHKLPFPNHLGYPEPVDGIRWYDPFESEPALFRKLALLELSHEAVLEFANRFGELRRHQMPLMSMCHLIKWEAAIVEMRDAIRMADKLSAMSTRARNYKAANEELRQVVDGMLKQADITLQTDLLDDAFVLRGHVHHLIDVVRVQFATSVIESKAYRNCEFCGMPFELRPQANRSDKLFCTDNCRVKSYQRRKKQAQSLRAAGKLPRDIARELETDIQTVKGWVKDVNPKEKK